MKLEDRIFIADRERHRAMIAEARARDRWEITRFRVLAICHRRDASKLRWEQYQLERQKGAKK